MWLIMMNWSATILFRTSILVTFINHRLIPYYRNHFQNNKEKLFSSKFPKTGRTAKAETITGLY